MMITYPEQRYNFWDSESFEQHWRDRFTFQTLCLSEGICPLCRMSLEPTGPAGVCRCCGYSWWMHTATEQEVEMWELTDTDDRRVITTERVIIGSGCLHPRTWRFP